MNVVILDDYQDAVRKLKCAAKLDAYPAKVYTNTVKGIGQLSVRLKDADIVVLIRERTHMSRQLIEKLPKLKLIVQTGRAGSHVDIAACTERGIAVAEGTGSPIAPAELTWALIMAATRRLPHYIGNLKHGLPILALAAYFMARHWVSGATEKLAAWLPDTEKRLA